MNRTSWIGSIEFSGEFQKEEDPVIAAATVVARIARSQAFTEGNKQTVLLIGRWILNRNGADGLRFIPTTRHRTGRSASFGG